MLTIIKHICIVLGCIIVIDYVFSYVFMNAVFNNTLSGESGGTINYVIKNKKDLDFLVVGASRAKHGIDPLQLTALGENGHNIGINATNVVNHLLVLDILLGRGVNPKTVLLQTDLYTYDTANDSQEMILDQIKRLYPYNTPLLKTYVASMGKVEESLYFFDTYKLNRKIANITFNFLKRNNVGNTNGYVGLPTIPYLPEDIVLFPDYIYTASSSNSIALEKIKNLLDKKQIKLIVLFSPSYKNILYNEEQQALLIKDLKKRGFTNIIDLSDIRKLPELEDVTYWRDGTHLSDKGAHVFSKIINKEIQKMSK